MIQMIGNPDTPAYEWMSSLYGDSIVPAQPPLMRLVHELNWEQGVVQQWHLATDDGLQWRLNLLEPDNKLKRADLADRIVPRDRILLTDRILLSGDGCWPHCVGPEAMRICVEQGVALAWFDRLEIADDPPSVRKQGAFYTRYPASKSGCLMVWAWGLATTARALKMLRPQSKVCAIGHSRGGKAALLAAAIDDAIDAVVANNSGTAGAASLAITAEGAESLAALVSSFPHWFSEMAQQSPVQARLAQLDCTALWQTIAPRPLLMLQARGDAWANPLGTRHAYSVLRKHWSDELEGTTELIEREGAHSMQTVDWLHAARWWRHVLINQAERTMTDGACTKTSATPPAFAAKL